MKRLVGLVCLFAALSVVGFAACDSAEKMELPPETETEVSVTLAPTEAPTEVPTPEPIRTDYRGTELGETEYLALAAQYPGETFLWDVPLGTQRIDCTAEELVLTELDEEILERLVYFPELGTVDLQGCGDLSAEQIRTLRERYPSLVLRYAMTYADVTVTSEQDTVVFTGLRSDDLDGLCAFLESFPNVTTVDLCECGINNETAMALNDRYEGRIRFLWTIRLGIWGEFRSDIKAYSTASNKTEKEMQNRLSSKACRVFSYCTDLEALDLGHQLIEDLEWIRPLKKLRILILADNNVSDVTPLCELSELEYVELFMTDLADISPLKELKNLKDLNLCHCEITDIEPLKEMVWLKRLWISGNDLPTSQREALMEALYDTELNFTAKGATEEGWREHERYFKMRSCFKTNSIEPWFAE